MQVQVFDVCAVVPIYNVNSAVFFLPPTRIAVLPEKLICHLCDGMLRPKAIDFHSYYCRAAV
jgi:hypothetical protein